QVSEGEVPIVYSSPVRTNVTPMDHALKCYGNKLSATGHKRLAIGVGTVRDYTGKITDRSGYAITQGGSLMAYSALGKLAQASAGDLTLVERFNTAVTNAELAYMNK